MNKSNDPFETIFDSLSDKTLPTQKQKDQMLTYVLMEGKAKDPSVFDKIGSWITVYPWRFAFGTAAMQAIVFTLLFGREYTNLLLSMFGG